MPALCEQAMTGTTVQMMQMNAPAPRAKMVHPAWNLVVSIVLCPWTHLCAYVPMVGEASSVMMIFSNVTARRAQMALPVLTLRTQRIQSQLVNSIATVSLATALTSATSTSMSAPASHADSTVHVSSQTPTPASPSISSTVSVSLEPPTILVKLTLMNVAATLARTVAPPQAPLARVVAAASQDSAGLTAKQVPNPAIGCELCSSVIRFVF